jgi:hypothetical protein
MCAARLVSDWLHRFCIFIRRRDVADFVTRHRTRIKSLIFIAERGMIFE